MLATLCFAASALGAEHVPEASAEASVEDSAEESSEASAAAAAENIAGNIELEVAKETTKSADASAELTMRELRELLEQQQAQIEEQEEKLAQQQERVEAQRELLQAMQKQLDQLEVEKPAERTEEQVAALERVEEESVGAQDEQAAAAPEELDLGEDFQRSLRIPGSNAALKVGGYVKMAIIDTKDPLGSRDRFVTASIPVGQPAVDDGAGEFSVTARQSRLNTELRSRTSKGTVRVFMEGDFAGDGDTYRLRHAFGQFGHFLAGKTYSTFVDSAWQPEEVDFEGINGRINVRQAQVRYFPRIGSNANLLVGLEDPAPDVTGGVGISEYPDVVVSWRQVWRDRWHIRPSVLVRRIKARWNLDPGVSDTATGWGVSFSGKAALGAWDSRDNLLFQLNYGDGFGRYVRDLQFEGGQDAVFDPVTGKLETLESFAGYIAYQHWWQERLRSTLILSWVNVDNLDFQDDSAYNETQRAALNLIFSPVPRVDLGAEVLWGERKNKNDESATARQIQLSAKYRF